MSSERSGSRVSATDGLVIDASVAIKAALSDGFLLFGARRLVAPTLLWSETAAGLSHLRWRAELTDHEVDTALGRLLAAPIEAHPSSALVRRAAVIARSLGWAKSYDAEYVALAELERLPLLTVDARLATTVSSLIEVLAPHDL